MYGKQSSELGAFSMGLQVSCCVCPQTATAAIVWPDPATVGSDLPCVSPPERVSDRRGAGDARSRPYVYRYSAQVCGGAGNWVPERQERDCHCAAVWRQGAQLHGRAL